MTPIGFLIMLVIAVVLLMLMILKLKFHPVMALFITSIGIGLALGNTLVATISAISSGFGGTLTGIGLTIILGSVLAVGIQDTGAATAIANFFIRLFKGKNLELAPSLTAFIVSIPVFGDIAMVLTAPIASILSCRKRISMSTMASFTGLGLFLTHGLVPPTPGILAVALMFEADLGMIIFYGIILSLIAFFGTWLLMGRWIAKEYIEPREDFISNIEPAKEGIPLEELTIKESNTPPFILSTLPLLVPVVLISLASFMKIMLGEGHIIRVIFETLGDKVIALFIGVILAVFLGFGRKDKILEAAQKNDGVSEGASFTEITLGNWVGRGLKVALLPLLITAMGGAMGGILKGSPVVEELGDIVASSGLLPVMIPFFIAAVLMTAVGSMTMAGLTAGAIVLPMMSVLGITPELAVLAIGAGTMTIDHLNNSGFWIMSQFFNLNTKQGLKYITLPTFVAAMILLVVLIIVNMVGLF